MRQAYSDRMLLSEAVTLIAKLLDGFPHGRPPNQTSYIGALANVLCQYPRMVAAKCVDPIKGVARETRFLPTISDLVAWCERESAFLRDAVERDDREQRLRAEAEARRKADEKLAADRRLRPTLQQLHEQYGPDWGIGAGDDLSRIASEKSRALAAEANDRLRAAEYAAAGLEPRYAAPGIPISLPLLKLLRAPHVPTSSEPEQERQAG